MSSLLLTNKQPAYSIGFSRPSKIELQGDEGKKISKEITSIQEDKPIQKLIYRLENDDNKPNQEMYDYLKSLEYEVGNGFEMSVLNISAQVWEALRNYFKKSNLCLAVPDACVGYNNNLMFTWSNGKHYLECEIFGDKQVEFFYKNWDTDAVWGEDITFNNLNQCFSNDILNKLLLFAW